MMAARLILFFAITSFCLAEEQVAALKESASPALPEEIKSAVVPDAAALAPKMDAPSPGEQAPVSVEPMVPAAVPITLSELYVAAEAGDEAKVKELLKEAVVPNELEPNGDTPLCVSLRKWHPAIALLLLEKQADPNIAGINGEFPVQFASLRRHPFLMEKLMSAGADPNRTFSHPVSA